MGLLFQLPISREENDFVTVDEKSQRIELRSYGLPLIFWGYLAAILTTLFFMGLAIRKPLIKLLEYPGSINAFIGYGLIVFSTISLISLLSFYFYQKKIIRKSDQLTIIDTLFFLPLRRKSFQLSSPHAFKVEHYLDSPNVAKRINDPAQRGFQNKGYFQLFAQDAEQKWLFIDRSSRKRDLEKIATLLFN